MQGINQTLTTEVKRDIDISTAASGLFFLYGLYALLFSLAQIFNYSNFHEEQRHLYVYYENWDLSNDYISQYIFNFKHPVLYTYLSDLIAGSGLDLISFHRIVMAVSTIVFVIAGAYCAYILAGLLPASAVFAMLNSQTLYAYQLNSGTSHSFAFPLLALGLICIIQQREKTLALLVVMSGLLYIPAAVILGLSLLLLVIWKRRTDLLEYRKWPEPILLLGVSGSITMFLLWLQLEPITGFGSYLVPNTQIELYPENSKEGRLFLGWSNPILYVVNRYAQGLDFVIPPLVYLCAMFFIFAIGIYGLVQISRNVNKRSISIFIISFVSIFIVIFSAIEHQSYRFLLYPFYTIMPILFIVGLFSLASNVIQNKTVGVICASLISFLLIFPYSIQDPQHRGFSTQIDDTSWQMLAHLNEQPKGTLVAGWSGGNAFDYIPYLAKQPLFTSHKGHYIFHENYLLEMRSRVNALISAYLSKDPNAITALRSKWDVDLLVVDRRHFEPNAEAITYFKPYDEKIAAMMQDTNPDELFLANPPQSAITFKNEHYIIIDIAKLTAR